MSGDRLIAAQARTRPRQRRTLEPTAWLVHISRRCTAALSALIFPSDIHALPDRSPSVRPTLPASAFKSPLIALSGVVDYEMYEKFREQFDKASDQALVVIELSTLGGDPEVARMMGEDVRFASEMEPARRFVFLGKAAIYSAGTTFMSFFARENRYLTRGTRLMIHERKLAKNLVIDGPLTTCLATVQATLNEIECSIAIQNEGFQNLIVGSSVTLDEVLRRAPSNWYLEAEEARNLGLIEAVL